MVRERGELGRGEGGVEVRGRGGGGGGGAEEKKDSAFHRDLRPIQLSSGKAKWTKQERPANVFVAACVSAADKETDRMCPVREVGRVAVKACSQEAPFTVRRKLGGHREEKQEVKRSVSATEQATCWGPNSPINYTLTLDDKEGRRWNERLHKEVEDAELVWNGRNTSSEMVAVVS
ncbi:hypothetical protein LSTR_LSTR007940 [Laodelphax striatellus]|uniref:Uncharacterized protein n=1 Tax=Laodelphax striatellus TaxID=195883 RepID=A0A482XQM5_LAOST|nr:hypothetical protein LSTR_LSTR007940 [Laodelphax striatellus]